MVIGIFIFVLLAPPLFEAIFPITFFSRISDKIYLTFIAFMASILCKLLNLGDEKKVFARVPWHALTTICGMGMLIAVAGKDRHNRNDVRLSVRQQYVRSNCTGFTLGFFRRNEPVRKRLCLLIQPSLPLSRRLRPG